MAKKKQDAPVKTGNVNDELEAELAKTAFASLVDLAENLSDMAVECVSTGFPQLDVILHTEKKGLPLGRDVEIYSREPEVGKAQPLSSLTKTPEGWTRMGDLKLGDPLASVDGQPSEVEGIYPQGFRRAYRVSFSDGRSCRCCGEHLWKVGKSQGTQPIKVWGSNNYRTLTTYEIAELLKFKSNRVKLSVPLASGDFGSEAALPLDPYLLGILLGDGSLIGGTPGVSTADDDVLAQVRDIVDQYGCEVFLNAGYDYRIVQKGNGRGMYCPNPVAEILRDLGLRGKDCFDKFVPKQYLVASKEARLQLLAGIINSDGTVGKKGVVSVSTVSFQLARDVQELVWSLGGISRINGPYKKNYTYGGRVLEGSPAYIVSVIMKNIGDVPLIARKRSQLNLAKEQTPRLSIVSVVPDGVAEMQCIKVSHPSHLYVTDNYIVTHNTSLALEIIRSFQVQGLRTAVIDVERTLTVEYLHTCGIITDPKVDPTKYALRIVRPEEAMCAEQILDLIQSTSNIFDLVVIDSVAAMDLKANLEKTADEPNRMGGIAKNLSDFFRKNVMKRACVVWVNQTRQAIGGYNPTGNIRYTTMGGRAMPFFASIRMELSLVEKVKGANDEVFAYKVKVFTAKNKVSVQWKTATLTYVMGEGFSTTYDYLDLGLKMGVIEKKGAWLMFGTERAQGEMKFYHLMKTKPELLEAIRQAVEGQDDFESEVVDGLAQPVAG